MMSTSQRLAYMADQIMRNFAALGAESAVLATADHIASFWDPRMKAAAFAMLDDGGDALTPAAASALRSLRDRGAPGHATAATRFGGVDEVGGSDAG